LEQITVAFHKLEYAFNFNRFVLNPIFNFKKDAIGPMLEKLVLYVSKNK
jgi:hypothetical protein